MTPHRAIVMVPISLMAWNAWRFLPDGSPLAIPTYAAAGLIILLAMAALRFRVPDVAFTLAALCVLVSGIFVLQGDMAGARIMAGGVLVTVALVTVSAADDALDKALAVGQGLTLVAWFAGNAARGTFGEDVAYSALGQAYGPYAELGLWLAILSAYAAAWYNLKGKRS